MFSFLKSLDWKLNSAVLFLMLASSLSLLSAKPPMFYKQLLFYAIGILAVMAIINFDWRSFVNHGWAIWGIYFLIIFLLAITLIFAPQVRGIRAWLQFGPFDFQAAEFAKLALIIILAGFFRKKHKETSRVLNLLYSFFYFAIPAVLIAAQPDFGSMLILFCIWFGFVLVSGVRFRYLAATVLALFVAGFFMWHGVLENYQKQRITGLFFPERDALGINYNVAQSKIAIGSAGFFGKGFRQGSQIQLGFLPEAQTDFIFAAVIEEWGLLSAVLMVFAFGFLVFKILKIGLDSSNNFDMFFCLGAAIYFLSGFVFNVGSTIGLTPVIGVPFPFLSYGGSHVLVDMVLLGVVQSIKIRKT